MRSQSRSMVIENASIVTPGEVLESASIKIIDGVIAEISTGHLNGCSKRLDAEGMYVLPGFIDLHSDAIEKEIEPRKGALFPIGMAVLEMDKKLAACGITTMYHSVAYTQWHDGVRNNGFASEIVREVNRLAPGLGVRTKVHARFEISNAKIVPYLEPMLREGQIHLLSIMDHTPGQGQYKNPRDVLKFVKGREATDEELNEYISRKQREAVPLRTEYVLHSRACADPGASRSRPTTTTRWRSWTSWRKWVSRSPSFRLTWRRWSRPIRERCTSCWVPQTWSGELYG